jgi:hypothetical protein
MKPLERQWKVLIGFSKKAHERKEKIERFFRSLQGSKALKSEAHERWELEDVSKSEAGLNRRKGSQTLRTELSIEGATSVERHLKQLAKKGPLHLNML